MFFLTDTSVDADLVKRAAVKARGETGSSGLDADGWEKWWVEKNFEYIDKLVSSPKEDKSSSRNLNEWKRL